MAFGGRDGSGTGSGKKATRPARSDVQGKTASAGHDEL